MNIRKQTVFHTVVSSFIGSFVPIVKKMLKEHNKYIKINIKNAIRLLNLKLEVGEIKKYMYSFYVPRCLYILTACRTVQLMYQEISGQWNQSSLLSFVT